MLASGGHLRTAPPGVEGVVSPLDARIFAHEGLPPHALYEARRRDDRDIPKRV